MNTIQTTNNHRIRNLFRYYAVSLFLVIIIVNSFRDTYHLLPVAWWCGMLLGMAIAVGLRVADSVRTQPLWVRFFIFLSTTFISVFICLWIPFLVTLALSLPAFLLGPVS